MSIDTEQKSSPMMLQWHACKKVAGDAVLLFRMGDFYEAFYEDAALIARELDLTLTKRQEIPMSGVPAHTAEGYIDKLVSKGFRIAVAEQTEDPKKVKGLVKREVVRVVTSGTVMNSSLLSDKQNNFCASVTRVGNIFGFSYIDLTTAEFRCTEFDSESALLNEIFHLHPSEILISGKFQEKHKSLLEDVKQQYDCLITTYDHWHFEHQAAHDFLVAHLKVHSLDGFGLRGMISAINSAGALLHYLQENLSLPIGHIRELSTYSTSQYMSLDRITQKNLELTEPLNESSRKHTLLGLLDQTQTPMGARLLRNWIKQPLSSISAIYERQDGLESFLNFPATIEQLQDLLDDVRDMERLIIRISSGYATPRDLVALKRSFDPIEQIKELLHMLPAPLIQQSTQRLNSLPEMNQLIARAIVDEPPLRLNDGEVIRTGYHAPLDELRMLKADSQKWMSDYQSRLREELGIKTLKIGFNRMFGYFIEVSKGQSERMPNAFQRRQTLANGERYISPELKDFETKILTADERAASIENELFHAIRMEVAKYMPEIKIVAHAIAQIDCLRSLAAVARQHNYTRPMVDESDILQISEGRHPVIEAANISEKFIPNDTLLNGTDQKLLLITGPNMAGKSTFIRQVALIAIMAQMGSFVPAKSVHLGIIDKVFTRIGASDDLSRGQSTFMVEMTETANILNNVTSKSLVILDEIGRGTSTYDGISIAWAVAEHLLLAEGKTPKTLFATHYWELTKLEEKISGAVNFNVAVHESEDNIIFLRKIVRGGTDKSYGIHVARLAGLPFEVISRAKEILVHLEENSNRKTAFEPTKPKRAPKIKPVNELQLTLFG